MKRREVRGIAKLCGKSRNPIVHCGARSLFICHLCLHFRVLNDWIDCFKGLCNRDSDVDILKLVFKKFLPEFCEPYFEVRDGIYDEL